MSNNFVICVMNPSVVDSYWHEVYIKSNRYGKVKGK